MVSQTQKNKNKQMADAIKKWMLKNEVAGDTRIYFNGKCYSSVGYGKDVKYETLQNMKGSDYSEYANDDTVTVTFEGDFYTVMNYSMGKLRESFDRLIESFGNYFYELGNAWNLSLYKI